MPKIFIIDDDAINNYISEHVIINTDPTIQMYIFTNPVEALSHINQMPFETDTIILLDLNMPQMSGWQVLDEMQHPYTTYILSSSILACDKEKSRLYGQVKGFISKPLSRSIAELVVAKQNLFALEQEVR